jgi:hypothetical protein
MATRLERELKIIRSEMSDLLSASLAKRPSVINVGGTIQEFTPAEALSEWRASAKRAERKIKEIRRAREE